VPSKIKKSSSSWGGSRPGAGRPRKTDAKAHAFEAAMPSLNRGFVTFQVLNPRNEVSPWTRTEMLKLSRWLYNNVGQATYIVEHLAQRAVGSGIVVQPKSSDRAWNRLVDRHFEDRCCAEAWAFDAGAQVNFYTAQSLILRQVALDGDFFAQFLKTQDNAARVRFIGGESIGAMGVAYGDPNYHDGIELDRFGAPRRFRVITSATEQKFQDVPAEDMLHFRHVRRHGQPRGVSWLHSAINNLRDASEIRAFVKGGFKAASQIAYVITSNEAVKVGLGAGLRNGNEAGETLTTHDIPNGVLIPKLRPGEKLESFRNEMPGQAFDPLMRSLAAEVAYAVGLPPEAMMLNVGLAGTEQRAVLEIAQNFLERLQQMVVDQFCRPFYKYWLWHEIQAGRLPYPGDDWWRHEWLAPKKITVDSGRDARAYSEQLDKGHISWQRFNNIQGLDAEAEEDEIIATAQRRAEKCAALGMDWREVFPNAIRNGAAAQMPAEPDADDSEDSPQPPPPANS
jgi:lambda family phage portal protein